MYTIDMLESQTVPKSSSKDPLPKRIFVGVGKFVESQSPKAHEARIIKIIDTRVLPKLSESQQNEVEKYRPVIEKAAKVAGVATTVGEVTLATMALVGAGIGGKKLVEKMVKGTRTARLLKQQGLKQQREGFEKIIGEIPPPIPEPSNPVPDTGSSIAQPVYKNVLGKIIPSRHHPEIPGNPHQDWWSGFLQGLHRRYLQEYPGASRHDQNMFLRTVAEMLMHEGDINGVSAQRQLLRAMKDRRPERIGEILDGIFNRNIGALIRSNPVYFDNESAGRVFDQWEKLGFAGSADWAQATDAFQQWIDQRMTVDRIGLPARLAQFRELREQLGQGIQDYAAPVPEPVPQRLGGLAWIRNLRDRIVARAQNEVLRAGSAAFMAPTGPPPHEQPQVPRKT